MESKPSDLAFDHLVTSKSKGFEVLVFLQKTKTSNGLQKVSRPNLKVWTPKSAKTCASVLRGSEVEVKPQRFSKSLRFLLAI